MADEDLFAAAEAKARQQAAEKGRNAEWYKGPQAAMSSFLSTMTGGGADYVDMLVRRQRGENVDVDQTRAKMQELHEDRPGWATGGRVGGTVAQYLPAGRALKAAGWAGAAAPGVMAGIKSGLAQGGIVGSFNELMRQLDRAGSTKRAEEQFNPLSSAGRVGLEVGFGGAGGALGGTIAGMTAPGVIATAAPKPLSPAAIAAATDAARAGEAAGLTGAGRMGAHEAARAAAARNPALGPELEEAATGLGGILSQAGRKVVPTGITPRETAAEAARAAGPFPLLQQDAARNLAAAQVATGRLTGQTLTPAAEAAVHAAPGMTAARRALVEADREAARATGMNARDVAAAHPMQTVGVLERMAERATDPASRNLLLDALGQHSPRFTAARTAGDRVAELGQIQGSLGRGAAYKPPEPAAGLNIVKQPRGVDRRSSAPRAGGVDTRRSQEGRT